jgi:hypothetical protein
MKHTVAIYGKQYEVSVYQKSKSVWEAVGDFDQVTIPNGQATEEIRVKGRSERSALGLWIDAAKYRGN